ncbi:MAG: hypothetical protein EB120_13140 [Proteobacteria bacterium]|nr:hypothetical protein [Pseudomonadota bacterium]NDG28104.1 hypothetical protein [Pseudomonadota bacterium]
MTPLTEENKNCIVYIIKTKQKEAKMEQVGCKFAVGQVVRGIYSKNQYLVLGSRKLDDVTLVYLKGIEPDGWLWEGVCTLTEDVLELSGQN